MDNTLITPLLPGAPRVLVHLRGVFSRDMADFWSRLRFDLRAHNAELLLMSDMMPEKALDVPLLRYNENLDTLPKIAFQEGWRPWLSKQRAIDVTPYLDRQRLWYGPEAKTTNTEDRISSLHYLDHFYRAVLSVARPALLVFWNGSLPGELLLADLAHSEGCPVQFMERGPFPGTVHLDKAGILAASHIATEKNWTWNTQEERAHWRDVMLKIEQSCSGGKNTWWGQPNFVGAEVFRKKLAIPPDKIVVFFAGQVDRDAQNLLFSPHFSNNLDAFRWFISALENNNNVFILGKHHPRSPVPPETFRTILGDRGVWLTDASLADCLDLAGRVAAVNSTVLYEGMMCQKPGLALGKGIFSDKGFIYEIDTLANAREHIEKWLAADGFEQRRERWLDFGAHFLASALFSTHPKEQAAGLRDTGFLAQELIQVLTHCQTPNYDSLETSWPCIDEVALWHYNQPKEHQGFKEVLRGANIILKATLGRFHHPTYNRLLTLGNHLWDKFGR